MTKKEGEIILYLRGEGKTYAEISEKMGISVNTLKSFIHRNKKQIEQAANGCRECGKPLVQNPRTKKKIFCSKSCREKWWKEHVECLHRKAYYNFTCACCGKPFTAYGNNHRKYCSHECYIKNRFGGGMDE